jgi:hypothetical protein
MKRDISWLKFCGYGGEKEQVTIAVIFSFEFFFYF